MKVAHLSTARSWRGGEQQLLYLARGLRARGIDEIVIAPPGAPLAARAAEEGLPVRPLGSRGGWDPAAMWRLRRLLRAEKIDLVHAHDAHAAALAAGGGWLAGGVKRVATRRVDFELHSGWLYRRGLDRVICISGAVRRVCRAAGLPEERLPLVYSGVDPDRLRGDYRTRELAAEFGFDRRDPVLLNVASLTGHKDQETLLEALLELGPEFPSSRLLVAGTGELEEALAMKARELALEERVRFLGFRDDIGALYALCDLFVMSSKLEGLCTAVLDAMAMERAVVVTGAGGLPELVEDGVQGRVTPAQDPSALAAALAELLRDRKLRERMGRAGRQRVLERFSVERMVEGTLAVYRELLDA